MCENDRRWGRDEDSYITIVRRRHEEAREKHGANWFAKLYMQEMPPLTEEEAARWRAKRAQERGE